VSAIEEARELVDGADTYDLPQDLGYRKRELLEQAQVLATIALAEEQRTANLIGFLPYARDRGWTHVSFDQLAQEVEDRLGIRPEFAPTDDEPPV
jgi:hypothetical protein